MLKLGLWKVLQLRFSCPSLCRSEALARGGSSESEVGSLLEPAH